MLCFVWKVGMQSEIFMYFVKCMKVHASAAFCFVQYFIQRTSSIERTQKSILVLSLHQKQATPNCSVGHLAAISRLILSSLLVAVKYARNTVLLALILLYTSTHCNTYIVCVVRIESSLLGCFLVSGLWIVCGKFVNTGKPYIGKQYNNIPIDLH